MLGLVVRMARHQLAALLAVAVAVLGAAALLTATAVLAETGVRSHPPVGRLAAADVVVAADQTYRVAEELPLGLPERRPVPGALVQELARLPQVTSAVGDVSFPAVLLGRAGRTASAADPSAGGHGWSSASLVPGAVVDGKAPARPDEVAVDGASASAAGLAPGDRVEVVAAGRSATYLLTAVLPGAPPAVFFSDDTARRLAGRDAGPRAGTVDLVALRTEPGTAPAVASAVRDLLRGDGLVVTTGDARGDAVAPAASAARLTLLLVAGSLSGVVLLIIGFVVAGAMAVSVQGQRRELALLRAVGATPRQVRQLAAGQATAVALLVLAPGIAGGYPLAGRFRVLLADLGVVPADLPLTVGPGPAVAAVLLCLGVVQVSARAAAWRASRLPVVAAVARSRSEGRTPGRARTRIGLLLVAAAATLSLAPLLSQTPQAAAATSLAGILAAIALGVGGPALVQVASAQLSRRLPGRAGPTTWLAVANTAGSPRRASATASALAMVVVFVLTYALTATTVSTATAGQTADAALAQQVVGADALGGLPVGLAEQVRAVPGVSAADPVSTTTVLWEGRDLGTATVDAVPALVLAPGAPTVLDLDVRAGSLAHLVGATVAVGSGAARSRGTGIGDRVHLVLGDGAAVVARVVAIYDRDLGFGPVVLSRDLAADHRTTALDQALLVRTDGSDVAQAGLERLLASRPGLTLGPAGGGQATSRAAPPETWINLAVLAVLLGYLLLGVANKLVAATAQRRPEIAMLRLLGATPAQVRSMIRQEASLVSLAAVLAGGLLSVLPLALLGIGFLGRPLPAGPVWLLPAVVLTVVATAFLALGLPVRRALRVPPVLALSRPG